MEREVLLIVGLGNPGREYEHTRHNAGFDVMSLLEKRYGVTHKKKMLQGLLAEVFVGEKKVVLCEPQTYMNLSGECVEKLLAWYHTGPEKLLVIYDDIDLPTGRVRVRRNGGPGTHNGMRSITERLQRTDFARIRVGTGDRPEGYELTDWVLGHYRDGEEKERMNEAFALAAEAAADWAEYGIERAMRTGNKALPAAEGAQA